MAKQTTTRRIICYECKGNGFIYGDFFQVKQCEVCESEGELLSDGKTHMKLMKVVDNARLQ